MTSEKSGSLFNIMQLAEQNMGKRVYLKWDKHKVTGIVNEFQQYIDEKEGVRKVKYYVISELQGRWVNEEDLSFNEH